MNNNQRWTSGMTLLAIFIVVVGAVAYNANRNNNKLRPFVGEPTASSQATTDAGSTNTSPAPSNQSTSPNCITPTQAAGAEGKSACVEFTAGYTYVSSKCNGYLDQSSDYSSGFSVWIPYNCNLSNQLIADYANKTIDVTGTVTEYAGAPEIAVYDASQIKLAP